MKPKALLTTIPSDSHSWNLIYMQLLLEEKGFEVVNLGPCTSYEEVENACLAVLPQAVFVSTVNGHGYLEGKELIRRIKGIPHMKGVAVYIGGKLSTDKNLSYLYAMELEMAGYSKAFYENMKAEDFISDLIKRSKKAV